MHSSEEPDVNRAMNYCAALFLVVALLLGGCAHDPSEPHPPEPTPMERVMNQRAKLSELNADPMAHRARTELGRAEAFLRRAEVGMDGDSELVPLLLDATDAQLARVQTLYARERALDELERVSEAYRTERRGP
jgi:hypothetical protein